MAVLSVYLCTRCIQGLRKPEKGCPTLWNWSFRQLFAAMCVLGIKPGVPIRVANFFFKIYFIMSNLLYVNVFSLCMCMCTMCVPGAQEIQERQSDFLPPNLHVEKKSSGQ